MQTLEVALQRLGVLVGDRAAADRAQVAGAPAFVGEPLQVARVGVEIRRGGPRHVAHLEPAQAVADVRGVADLAHLAVADDVDAGVDLVSHAVSHGRIQQAVVLGAVDLLAAVLGEHELDQLGRPRQAADVGGQDARHQISSRTVSTASGGAGRGLFLAGPRSATASASDFRSSRGTS